MANVCSVCFENWLLVLLCLICVCAQCNAFLVEFFLMNVFPFRAEVWKIICDQQKDRHQKQNASNLEGLLHSLLVSLLFISIMYDLSPCALLSAFLSLLPAAAQSRYLIMGQGRSHINESSGGVIWFTYNCRFTHLRSCRVLSVWTWFRML